MLIKTLDQGAVYCYHISVPPPPASHFLIKIIKTPDLPEDREIGKIINYKNPTPQKYNRLSPQRINNLPVFINPTHADPFIAHPAMNVAIQGSCRKHDVTLEGDPSSHIFRIY